ncbi:hypothetical protein WA158_000488 [Blastocystis sp. Blastoise]
MPHSATLQAHPYKQEDRYEVKIGDSILDSYTIRKEIGSGKCSTVYLAWDIKHEKYVALKINRRERRYEMAAMREIRTIVALNRRSGGVCKGIPEILAWFNIDGYVFEVIPFMDKNLFEILLQNKFNPFDIETLRTMVRQILSVLGRMHKSGIVHTDIKPENIMFMPSTTEKSDDINVLPEQVPDFNSLCLIDFGSVSSSTVPRRGLITTRTYRAPEVILDLHWSFPSDMWSLGCMLYELATGHPIFKTHQHFFGNREHLAMIEKLLGPIPQEMYSQLADQIRMMYKADGYILWPPPVTMETEEEKQPGGWGHHDVSWSSRSRAVKAVKQSPTDIASSLPEPDDDFVDFLTSLLKLRPEDRLTVDEAIKHPFVTKKGTLPAINIDIVVLNEGQDNIDAME